jgi:hypothetical protein
MKYIGNFSGSAPVIKKYKASAAYVVGIIMVRSVSNASGQMSTSTTTTATDSLGLLLDLGMGAAASGPITYSTTQGADEAVHAVIVNPDQILRAQMVTGATGTGITADTIVTASSNGLTFVGGTSVASPDMDEGIVWYTSGANVGKSRKITSTGATVTGTVIVPFAANAVGDTFCYAGINIGLTGATLTTDLKNVRADIAVSTGASISCLDLELNGANDSYAHFVLGDSVWSNAT